MNVTLKSSVLITVLLTAFHIASPTACRAQGEPETANVVVVSTMPTNGTFWSMQLTNFPPMPFNPFPNSPLYSDGTPGQYYYDDLGVDYASYWAERRQSQEARLSVGGGVTADDDAPPLPGGGGGGGSGGGSGGGVTEIAFTPPVSGYTNCETWTNFFLEIEADSNVVSITISNTLPGMSCELREKTNLTDPAWTDIQTLTATGTSPDALHLCAGTNAKNFQVYAI